MSGLFAPQNLPTIPVPPAAPSMSDPAIQEAMAEEKRMRQTAGGRASTFLTDTQSQRTAQKNAQNTLGGI